MSLVLTSQNFIKVSWNISNIDLTETEAHVTKSNPSTLLWIFERCTCWCCDDLFLKWKWWFKTKVKLSFILHHHFVLGSLLLHVMSHYNYHNDDCYVGTWVFFSQITFLQRIALSTQLLRLSSNVGSHYSVLHRMWSNINQDKPWQKLSN